MSRLEEDVSFPLGKVIAGAMVAIFFLVIIFGSIAIVPSGHRGVITTFGDVEEGFVFNEGFHTKVPIAQDVTMMEVRTKKFESEATSASKDLQDTKTSIALNYHIVPDEANDIYQLVGLSYEDRIIQPAIQEVVKSSTAKFNAEELITKRETVKSDIEQSLIERLGGRGLIVETVSITDFQFSPEFTQAIEQKVVAQQQALQAENILKRIEVEARQAQAKAVGEANANIARSEGEAKAIQIINSALANNPNYIEWLRTNKWDGILPKVTGGAIPFVEIPIA